ncbi:MAG: hypothetical protein JW934_01430 [Anaerolineae bacterium]|nr:hypothetical protein [Anaerolineae bacterium]
MNPEQIGKKLNDFDPAIRARTLDELLALVGQGQVELPPPSEIANMHSHTFFSFNAYSYSPTALAWLARKNGYGLMGIVDFDVLDGVDEFLIACDRVGVRGSAGMETRVFVPEFATREINSPGEPGIFYHMGIGFTSSKTPDAVSGILASMSGRAAQRNRDMAARVNAYLDPVKIDYERDVLPLTPANNATERHMVAAYIQKTSEVYPDRGSLVCFWADKLKMEPAQVEAVIGNPAKFQDLLRAKLMKRGGVGYVQPDDGSFPTVEKVNELIVACGALPCATWLDGTLAGEQAEEELLELLINKGIVAFNIIPDRNWNIADPQVKAAKLDNLYYVVELAQKLDLPLNIGTEMNAFGQKRADNFDAPELAPVRQAFLDGAYFIYGHTVMQRALGLGYQSEWAKQHLPSRGERNEFYTRMGRQIAPGKEGLAALKKKEHFL